MESRRTGRAVVAVRQLIAAATCVLTCVSSIQAQELQSPAPPAAAQPAERSTPAEKKPAPAQLREASDAYLAGARLLDRDNLAAAEQQFARAVRLDPTNSEYAQALALARQHRVTELVQQSGRARLFGRAAESQRLLAEAQQLDPSNQFVAQHLEPAAIAARFQPSLQGEPPDEASAWSRSPTRIAGPVTLLPREGRQSFHLRADSQQTIRQVLSRYGIQAFFDDSVSSKSLPFDLDDATYAQATDLLFEMAGVFASSIDAHTVVIAKDSTENRQRLEHLLEETIYIPGQTVEQMNELGTVIRSVFDVKQVSVQATSGSLVLRAPEDTLTAVNLILSDMIEGNPEVVLDMRLYTVSRTRQRQIGSQLPQQIGIYNVQTEASKLVSDNQSIVDQAISEGLITSGASDIEVALALIASGLVSSSLLSNTIGFLGGGLTMTGVTMGTAPSFTLALNSSNTQALDNLQLRIGDRQTAEFRSGMKYPIMTGSYSLASTSGSSLAGTTINGVSAQTLLNQLLGSSTSTSIPQFQYEDLGLILKATPTVQRSGLLRIKIEMRIEALSGTSLNNIPILGNRQYSSDLTLREGETSLIASTLSKSEAGAVSGYPTLAELPGFQSLSAYKDASQDSSELILLLTPHIVRHRSNQSQGPRIAYEQRLPN